MTGVMNKKFQEKLINIPQHLQYSTSAKSMKYAELLSAVNCMDKEKAISFAKPEFHKEYGVNGKSGLRAFTKKTKTNFILRIVDNGTDIIVFKNDVLQGKK